MAVTQAPGTNTRGNDCRDLSLLVRTTDVSTGCMKNEICSVLWLLGTAPHGTQDVRDAQALCCFPPWKPWEHFGICHKHPCSLQESGFYVLASPISLPVLCAKVWQYGNMGLWQRMSQHDSIGAHRAHWGIWSL